MGACCACASLEMFKDRNEETPLSFVALRVEELDEAISRRQAVQADTCPGGKRVSLNGS